MRCVPYNPLRNNYCTLSLVIHCLYGNENHISLDQFLSTFFKSSLPNAFKTELIHRIFYSIHHSSIQPHTIAHSPPCTKQPTMFWWFHSMLRLLHINTRPSQRYVQLGVISLWNSSQKSLFLFIQIQLEGL